VVIPQKIHSVIDNGVRASPTHEISYRVTANDSRGCKEIPGALLGCAVTGRCWSPLVVEILETAKRIENSSLKKQKSFSGSLKSQARWLAKAIHLRFDNYGRD
jgi:hypothetical protein